MSDPFCGGWETGEAALGGAHHGGPPLLAFLAVVGMPILPAGGVARLGIAGTAHGTAAGEAVVIILGASSAAIVGSEEVTIGVRPRMSGLPI